MPPDEPESESLRPTAPLASSPPVLGEHHRLVVWLEGAAQTWSVPSAGLIVVGRAQEADIQIASPTVSRHHARIETGPGVVRLTDLGSQNGTRVNGERMSSERALAYGDIVNFGEVMAAFIADRIEPLVAPGGAGSSTPERTILLGDRTALVADPAMLNLYGQIELLAPSDLTVLILGETGTGKELAASALRYWSKRRSRPLVTINCASLTEALAESELFGHERGAFSGAVQSKAGLLESAPGGTIFLDEIGDLSLGVQAKLLRVLETHRLTRLGSVKERLVDIRVVAATHRNLVDDVRTGRFREDLYYRLSAAVVRLPPLRARARELPILARAFLADARRSLGRPPLVLSEAALERLQMHNWPGNVRELKNLADYLATTVSDATVGPHHLSERLGAVTLSPAEPPLAPTPIAPYDARAKTIGFRPLAETSREFEREQIEGALLATDGNKTQAARLLGVPLRTFMEKVKRHGIA